MARNRWTVVFLLALAGLTLFAWLEAVAQEPAAKAPAHKIIGSEKCGMCHKAAAKGNQLQIWAESGHAKAFTELASPASLEVAKKLGVTDPQKDEKCLVCHSTKAFLKAEGDVAYKLEEGVGCEACHGAGSDYKAMNVMKDRGLAVAAGMIVPTEATCVKCHNENSPTYKPFNFAEKMKAVAHPNPAKQAG